MTATRPAAARAELGGLAVTPRPLPAYRDMFLLTDHDLLAGPILDCPAGASPFGAQVRAATGQRPDARVHGCGLSRATTGQRPPMAAAATAGTTDGTPAAPHMEDDMNYRDWLGHGRPDKCRVVRAGEGYDGVQGLAYSAGVSAESAGARGLCLHTLVIPPGGRAKAHLHAHHESAIYVVSGVGEMWWGADLAHHEVLHAGDFVYIPAGVPHLPGNPGAEPALAVVARTDPNEQESVVLLPELDALVP